MLATSPEESELFIMEPMTATPIVPPTERRNCIVEVETPITLCGTAFCTASMNSGSDIPKPMPVITMFRVAVKFVEWTSMRESMNTPAAMTSNPDHAQQPVAPDPRHDLAADGARYRHRDHHRHGDEAGVGGGRADDALHEQGDIG